MPRKPKANQEEEFEMEEVVTEVQANDPVIVTINGKKMEVSAPYHAGDMMSELDALALNQARAKAVADAVRAFIKRNITEAEEPIFEADRDTMIADFLADYDTQYVVGAKSHAIPARPVDPVKKEAERLANAQVIAALRERRLTKKKFLELKGQEEGKQLIADMVAKLAAPGGETWKQAEINVSNRSSDFSDVLDGMADLV